MKRKGMGKGKGKGYKNIIKGYDKKVHSESARGRKQPQKISHFKYGGKSITKPKKNYDVVSAIIEYEGGSSTDNETLRLFSHLVKTGQAWTLQGHYGRTAKALMDDGYLNKDGSLTKKATDFIELNKDTDGDGVPDKDDCDPNDPTKQADSKLFEVKKGVSIQARYEKTRSGFRHLAVLYIDGVEVDNAKATYQNRTWESYEFESVIMDLVNNTDSLTEKEKKAFKDKQSGKEKAEVEQKFKTIGAIAQMGEIFGETKKEKNDWKKRMLKAGLPQLDVPDDWDSLSEKEKEKRLNNVIAVAKGMK